LNIEKIPHIEGPLIIEPQVFGDSRGYFYESYNEIAFSLASLPVHFRQDNQSKSSKGVLRGLHFQSPPFAQGKLVRVIRGRVLDVIVDIRKASPSYGKHFSLELSEENFRMLWVPPGFAHGFVTLEDDTLFLYKCTEVYNKASEGGLMWDDSTLGIDWGFDNPKLSDKDLDYPPFEQFQSPF
jgi:dTDP-4-dehydrorhamnose 3,5-epimerase